MPSAVVELSVIEPPTSHVLPGSPDEVSVMLDGVSATRVSFCVGSVWLVSVTLGMLIVTTCLFVPVTL